MNADDVSKIDWSKIAMGVAVAIVFVMQQYHAMKLEDVRSVVVPRHEYTETTDKIIPKNEVLVMLKTLDERITSIEEKR